MIDLKVAEQSRMTSKRRRKISDFLFSRMMSCVWMSGEQPLEQCFLFVFFVFLFWLSHDIILTASTGANWKKGQNERKKWAYTESFLTAQQAKQARATELIRTCSFHGRSNESCSAQQRTLLSPYIHISLARLLHHRHHHHHQLLYLPLPT